LTDLITTKQRTKNYNVAVKEWNEQIIFLRKLVPGGTSRSYGIQVARIAGLPEGVLERAKEILGNLEGKELDEVGRPRMAHSHKTQQSDDLRQLSLFGAKEQKLKKWIQDLDISTMAPLEALIELNRLKEYLDKEGK
jgi:DNA mismatch repair protein MutS